jgi:hypothetical protein
VSVEVPARTGTPGNPEPPAVVVLSLVATRYLAWPGRLTPATAH